MLSFVENRIDMKKTSHVNSTQLNARSKMIWILFSLIFCIEFAAFKYNILKEISPYYPSGFDQSIFLAIAYTLYDTIKRQGFFASLSSSPFLSTGALFPYQAVLFFYVFGFSRFSALLPNIIYFIILQIITLVALRHFTKKNYLSTLMLGWILTIQSPVQIIGGLFDFRMDFVAFCLYGIFIACVMKSQLFVIKKWSLMAGLCALFIILMRTITITYMLSLVSIMTFYFFYQSKKICIPTVKMTYITRFHHSVRILFFIISTSCIFIYLNKSFLYHYYVIGHVISHEKYVRVLEAGIKNSYELWGYYPAMLLKQIGLYTSTIMFLVLCLYLFLKPMHKLSHSTMLDRRDWYDHFLFLVVSFFTPILILTFDTSKSSIVGSIAVMPLLWIMMWIIFALDEKKMISKIIFIVLSIIAGSTLFIGLNNQIHNISHKQSFNYHDRATINQMYQDIGNYAIHHDWSTITISTDRIMDYLIPTNIKVFYYENNKKLLTIRSTLLGGSMFPESRAAMLNALKKSHIVIFNISNNYPSKSPYPADLYIASLKPLLTQYTEQRFSRLGDYKINESLYRVYVKNDKNLARS